MYKHIKVPSEGKKITVNPDLSLNVPDQLDLVAEPGHRVGLIDHGTDGAAHAERVHEQVADPHAPEPPR